MKARLILIAAAGVVLGAMAAAPPAEAGHSDWSFGVGFHVGGLHFRVGFSPLGYGPYPGPFFLTTSRLHYPGYGCNGACFRRGAGYYHHVDCPLLSFHFGRVGYGPRHYLPRYSPYRGYNRGYGPYPSRPYGYYRYRDGHRHDYRRYSDGRYRDHRHHGYRNDRDFRHDARRYRDHRQRGHRSDRSIRPDNRRYRDHDGVRGNDRRRDYRDDRRRRGRDGDRDRAHRRQGRGRPPG
ncbi:MAG: hypothetical protein ACYTFN_25010 [Planctomycetota bacterium]|jgi:hypothetical protein